MRGRREARRGRKKRKKNKTKIPVRLEASAQLHSLKTPASSYFPLFPHRRRFSSPPPPLPPRPRVNIRIHTQHPSRESRFYLPKLTKTCSFWRRERCRVDARGAHKHWLTRANLSDNSLLDFRRELRLSAVFDALSILGGFSVFLGGLLDSPVEGFCLNMAIDFDVASLLFIENGEGGSF